MAQGHDPVTGRFLPGNKIGKGRPSIRREVEIIDAFNESITKEDMIQIAIKLKSIALRDKIQPSLALKAIEIILDRIMGKPQQMIDIRASTHQESDSEINVPEEIEDMNAYKEYIEGEFKEEEINKYLEDREKEKEEIETGYSEEE